MSALMPLCVGWMHLSAPGASMQWWNVSMTRKDKVEAALLRGDVTELLALVKGHPCACQGSVDGEPHCICRMNSLQVRQNVSFAALRTGRLVRLKQKYDS